MNHLVIVCLILSAGICSALAGEDSIQYESVEGTTFYYNSCDRPVFENRIHDHMAIFKRLTKDSIRFNKDNRLEKQIESNTKVHAVFHPGDKEWEYNNLLQCGISIIRITDCGIPRFISFDAPPSRNFTKEEYDYHNQTNKIPPSYATLTEEQAVTKAKSLIKLIEGAEESKKYDSVSITPVGVGNAYIVTFRVKIKNDIWDSRSADIVINANTGEIESFSGDGKCGDVDFSYIPKIPKSQALQMYEDEIKRLGADISNSSIVLCPPGFNSQNKWEWNIYGNRKDKKLHLAAKMVIDSETGEVLVNRMDY
jgi:hypothetical protein